MAVRNVCLGVSNCFGTYALARYASVRTVRT